MSGRSLGSFGVRNRGDLQSESLLEKDREWASGVNIVRQPEEEKHEDPLDVEIAEGLKYLLLQRFDLARVVQIGENYVIKGACILCDEYRYGRNCGECPFTMFQGGEQFGCMRWLDQVLARAMIYNFIPVVGSDDISWSTDRAINYHARHQIGTLWDMIVNRKLFIKWIE